MLLAATSLRRSGRGLARAACLTLLLAAAMPACAQDGQAAALALIAQRHLGDNLAALGAQVAVRTSTYAVLVKRLGQEQAGALVRQQLKHALPNYQPQWNANLAAAYASVFDASELASLARDGQASPVAAKFAERQRDIGEDMRVRSTPVLQAYVTEAMNQAFKLSK
ncbi:hypothetical protein [Bordetella holmesii]|uniref:Uncharacterized protein n=2 Tax=Bordetella holmesii TaxID=35814 RepID=A0ABN0S1L2_9BORD|nr:hypothetical protein [Bordetella holmesii]AHV94493.1 hypothetical protein D560_0975 [Bordetella holmesii ATCC 51541]AIT25639.1 hypothetical protein D558_0959 [Bordetella holmesii 44057]EWM44046.1 hypothetical protein D556_0971 [Bordetella holmesii 41130]EWM46207.1 hypothetical protein D555_0980 [Bordetella holmesii 35009]EWM50362.1 hypothetical protein D557_0205 [Bordetella holmesii 70147]